VTLAVSAVLIGALYAHLKLVKWSLNTEKPTVRQGHVKKIHATSKLAILAILGIELGPGIGTATLSAIEWAGGLL
jgi:hypothetical protein